MRRYLYLSTAVAGAVMTAGAGTSFAQCVTTQNCAELGYTETSCPDGTGIKCPFGNTFACTGGSSEITPEQCTQLGFTHACTGTNESGSGEACGGKYITCTCKAPYTWSGSGCTCDSNYQYSCTGAGESGSGTACSGKYIQCTCTSPYTWSGSACTCPSIYQHTCTGTGYSGGLGPACGGKYVACTCISGYIWNGSSCNVNPCTNKRDGANGQLYCCSGVVVGVKATGMNFYVAMHDVGEMDWNTADTQCREYSFCSWRATGSFPTIEQVQIIYKKKSQLNTLLSANGGTRLRENYYWTNNPPGESGTSTSIYMSDGSYAFMYPYARNYVRPILTSW